jgi:hypothetical protein
MTNHPEPLLRLRGPADLIEAIPYLLGFHPSASLVLVGLDAGRSSGVTITARIDLADVEPASGVVPDTVDAVVRSGADAVVVIRFDDAQRIGHDPPGLLPGADVIDAVRGAVQRRGLTVLDALLVASGRWWSYGCVGQGCCPADGQPLEGDSSLAAASATYAGLVALPTREDLSRTFEPHSDERRRALLPLLEGVEDRAVGAILDGHAQRHERSVKRALFAAARDADGALFPGTAGALTDAQAARFAAGLAHTTLRDSVWLAVDQGRLDGRSLWLELARRVPEPYDAPALFLYGWAEWRAGHGVMAGLAAERALASDPGYTAADLLLGALAHGLDPRRTPRLRMPRPA